MFLHALNTTCYIVFLSSFVKKKYICHLVITGFKNSKLIKDYFRIFIVVKFFLIKHLRLTNIIFFTCTKWTMLHSDFASLTQKYFAI